MSDTHLPSNFPPLRIVLAVPREASTHYDLGCMYAYGQDAVRNDAEAARWFLSAAEQGHAAAQYALACMYCAGKGVARDAAEALAWFSKSAGTGHAPAQYALARIYGAGDGV
ncbi:MAG: tetratricopeptide repeat protein, partial [Casimicrobiaceae bacterium]